VKAAIPGTISIEEKPMPIVLSGFL
jgi:hypothetical protein